MKNHLADILGNDHPALVRTIDRFESASGRPGIDTRLIGDVTELGHTIMRNLGLDTANTTAKELYQALNAAVKRDPDSLYGAAYVVLRLDGGIVSFNVQDVAENSHHELAFDERQTGHAQRHLRMEIIKRYAEHDRTDEQMVHELAEEAGLKHEMDAHHPVVHLQAGDAKPKILAIGDIFTDAFIKLNESSAKIIDENDGQKWLAMPFGQKPAYDRVDIIRSVGPSPNAAVSAARIGLDVSLMAWVGGDDVGKEAIAHLKQEGVSTNTMVVEQDKATSYWYVLRFGADRTMLVKSEKYRYEWTDPSSTPDWVYLSYVGEDSWPLHEALIEYLGRNQNVKLAFQPGTFHFKWGVDKLRAIYERSHIVVMNREEAVDVTGQSYDSVSDLAKGLHDLGPKIVVITDGPNGSYASFDDMLVTIPNYPDPAKPLDRTGAGDAFASTIVSALALGESMETALTWAPINSMSVVQKLGAQEGLLERSAIDGFLKDAPDTYRVTDMN